MQTGACPPLFRKTGFSLIEVLIAALFLASVLAGMLVINSQSNRSSMDAYYEMVAMQLALEPIEAFRAFGYSWLKNYSEYPLADFPLGWSDLGANSTSTQIRRPAECFQFKREITLTPVEKGTMRGIRVDVKVAPKDQDRLKTWLSRDVFSMSALVLEQPR